MVYFSWRVTGVFGQWGTFRLIHRKWSNSSRYVLHCRDTKWIHNTPAPFAALRLFICVAVMTKRSSQGLHSLSMRFCVYTTLRTLTSLFPLNGKAIFLPSQSHANQGVLICTCISDLHRALWPRAFSVLHALDSIFPIRKQSPPHRILQSSSSTSCIIMSLIQSSWRLDPSIRRCTFVLTYPSDPTSASSTFAHELWSMSVPPV